MSVHDLCEHYKPFYIYRYDDSSHHLSYTGDSGYRELGTGEATKTQALAIFRV